ncbi:MAG: murein biosynthesis integral membrane protein MurJ [Proteobacteria bacterium]|nr:MAG: murein biosynthesis integral membrane protein MurJ [Pseudomonadota bacterium]
MANHLLRGTGVVSSLTFVSRILGFVRDMIIARLFGAGLLADAFFVAFRIPNLLRSILAEGAFTSAFVPVFVSEHARGPESAKQAMRQTSGLLLIAGLGLTCLGVIFSREIVLLFAPGFQADPYKLSLCIKLTRIMFSYIIFVSLVALINGALNAFKIFGAAAWAQVWMNLVWIAGAVAALYLDDESAVYCLAWSVILGGFVQVAVQFPALRRAGILVLPSTKCISPATLQIVKLMLPALLGATIYQLGVFLNTLLASFLEEGSVSWLYYADRLVQLPIGIFSIALASVLLPALAEANESRDEISFSRNLTNALRYTSFIIIPCAAFLFCCAEPLAKLIFERGEFSPYSSSMTALAVQGYCLGLWAISCHAMLVRVFIARKDTVTPVLTGILSLLVNLVVSLACMGPVRQRGAAAEAVEAIRAILPGISTLPELGHIALALGSSAGTLASMLCAAILVRRSHKIGWSPFLSCTLRSILASLVLVWVCNWCLESFRSAPTALALSTLLSLTGYLLINYILRAPEIKETFGGFRRLIKSVVRRQIK